MPQIDDIRRLWSERRDVTEIARVTGHDRKTARKYLQMEDFSPEAPAPKAKGPSKLDPFKGYIDRTLEADRHEWRKQRHTATRIYGEILEMGYEGKYSLVQCYVRERRREPKTFGGFDFSRIQGRDAQALAKLSALADLNAHRNVAFIGPGGIGKTHLAQAYGRECCMRGR